MTIGGEADKARAVNDFLTEDLLTQAEPANCAAEDHVTLLEVLDRAAAKVGERFAGRPEVEDALRRTIASAPEGAAGFSSSSSAGRSCSAESWSSPADRGTGRTRSGTSARARPFAPFGATTSATP